MQRLLAVISSLSSRSKVSVLAAVAIGVCVAAYLRSVALGWTLLGWDIDGGFLNAHLYLQRSLSGWDFYQSLGASNAPNAAKIPLAALEWLLERAHLNPAIVQWLITGLFLLLPAAAIFAYGSIVFPTRRVIAFVSCLAMFFNLYVAVCNHTTPYLQFDAAMAAGPLIAACIIAFTRRPTYVGAIAFVLSAVAVSLMGSNLAGALVGLGMVIAFTLIGCSQNGIRARSVVILLGAYALINCFWIIPLTEHFLAGANLVEASQYLTLWGDSTLHAISAASTPFNFLRLVGTWDWTHVDAWGHGYVSFAPQYNSNWLLIALSFLLLAFAVVAGALNGRASWMFLGGFVVALFLMKGTAAPFGGIYDAFYHHIPGFKMFRDPYTKFGIAAIPFLAVLAGIGVDEICKRLHPRTGRAFVCLASALIVASIIPYWSGDMFKRDVYMQNYYVSIPTSYTRLAAYLNNPRRDQRGRALVFPFSPNLSYTALNWNFVGPDPLQYLIARPTIFEANGFADPFVNAVFSGVDGSASALRRVVERARIRYIIVHRDVVRTVYGADNYRKSEEIVRRAGGILIASFGRQLILYRMPDAASRTEYGLFGLESRPIRVTGLPLRLSFVLSARNVSSPTMPSKYQDERFVEGPAALALPNAVGLDVSRPGAISAFPVSGLLTPRDLLKEISSKSILVGSELFSTQLDGELTSGEKPFTVLRTLGFRGAPWQNTDRYFGVPSAEVYRDVPIAILPGDHVYALIYKAGPSSLSAGVSVNCCFPAHDTALAPPVYPILDGKLRAAAFRIDYPVKILANLTVFGDAADELTREPAYILTASVTQQGSLAVPEALLVAPPKGGRFAGPPANDVYALRGHMGNEDAALVMQHLRVVGVLRESRQARAVTLSPIDQTTIPAEAPPPGAISDDMRVKAPGRGLLVSSIAWNPGWVAKMDGRMLPKQLVDGAFNGWYVPRAGFVRVVFWPRVLLPIGALIALLGAVTVFALTYYGKLKRSNGF